MLRTILLTSVLVVKVAHKTFTEGFNFGHFEGLPYCPYVKCKNKII